LSVGAGGGATSCFGRLLPLVGTKLGVGSRFTPNDDEESLMDEGGTHLETFDICRGGRGGGGGGGPRGGFTGLPILYYTIYIDNNIWQAVTRVERSHVQGSSSATKRS